MLRPAPSSRAVRLTAALTLAGVLVFVIWNGLVQARHLLDLSAAYGVTVDAPATDPGSPTGYADGRRSLILPAGAADSAHWVMQTQQMIAQGDWRIRHVDYDNAPRGREVHWSGPPHWWLALLGWSDHRISGRPIGIGVERGTLWFGPVMLLAYFALLLPVIARRWSLLAAAAVAAALVAAYPFHIDFLPGRADHHGLANIAAGSMVFALLLGAWPGAAGRRPVVASGVAGGFGLWISAATLVPVLVGVGLGFVLTSWRARRAAERPAWLRDPDLLRWWALAGAGTSLAAYLLEYFPADMGLRLEVNHPLYALAWAGAGEGLRAFAILLQSSEAGTRTAAKRALAGGSGALVVLPLTLLATGATSFTVADPLIYRVHALYIAEFQGLARHFSTHELTWGWVAICLPMLLLVPAWIGAFRRPLDEFRILLLLVTVPATIAWLLGWWQMRWLGLANALTAPVLVLLVQRWAAVAPVMSASWARFALGALLFVPGLVDAVRRAARSGEFTAADVRSLAERDIAHWLRLRAPRERLIVASAPTTTTRLIAYGGLDGLGTLYWENAEGFKQASALFGASSVDEAAERVRRLGITHIVSVSWDAFELAQAKLHQGLSAGTPLPAGLFLAQLMASPVPPRWLRPLPFKLPANAALDDQRVRIWEVVPAQSEAASVAAMAAYHLELGDVAAARQLEPELNRHPSELPANVMLAGITSRARDRAAFAAALARVISQLPAAGQLSLQDHVNLVVVLAVAQEVTLARTQYAQAVAKADEQSLRRLTPGALADFLALGEALGVALPDPALAQLARSLVPPSRRR